MVRVLIVAKTHMGKDTACVGALNLETNEGIRLLGSNGSKLFWLIQLGLFLIFGDFEIAELFPLTLKWLLKQRHHLEVLV